jgi:cell wall-associated NlpC family hydrolase
MRNTTGQARIGLLLAAATLVAGFAAGSADANPDLDAKRARAEAVYHRYLDAAGAAEQAQEALNLANIQLAEVEHDLGHNTLHLGVAKRSLVVARENIAERLRAIYMEDQRGGALEIVLGATSLDDLVNRVDLMQRVSALDGHVLGQVKKFRTDVTARRVMLREARERQEDIVAVKAAKERELEARVAELRELYEAEKDEIARLEAEEARRAAAAAAAARRLAAAAAEAQQQEPLAGTSFLDDDPVNRAAPPARYGGVVGIAMQYLGVPYVWGGMSPAGFDCSGLIAYAYAQMGVSLPHHAASQFNYGIPVSRDQLQPGDLVFFNGLGHAGIYIGGGNFVHAPHTGDVVKVSSIYQSWYNTRWEGGRRIA